METMTQIPVPTRLVERLRWAMAAGDPDVPHLIEQAIEQYLSEQRSIEIEKEQQAYEAQHAQLLTTYQGQYIAMRGGQVVDHDTDRVALSRRVRSRYGSSAVLITPVLRQARQTITVRSPHLQEPSE